MAESDDTNTEPTTGTPTTNDELGVIGAQQANAQAALGAAAVTIPPDDATLRLQALQVAQAAGGTPDEVIARANTYFDYLKDGRSNG